ncbi:HDL123Wp [Eremothecium sinecaudum]|uniref:HDL123Wp n=1 Tax=Eremothecium sinecaudum TaxID=45286 RepID=A0A0X8HRH4_9SACH|nr:HDL123Wp [Eremothecium sinecaudum]AMD20621.1 HDL123Wp [Eremothecium sinecaudum]
MTKASSAPAKVAIHRALNPPHKYAMNINKVLILESLYELLLNGQTNRVSLVRLQTDVNNHPMTKQLSSQWQTLKINDILDVIKVIFPKQTSLSDGQIIFYNLQIVEIRDTLLEVVKECQTALVKEVKLLEQQYHSIKNQDDMKLRRERIMGMYRDTILAKLQSFKYFHPLYGKVEPSPVVHNLMDLEKIKGMSIENLSHLQLTLQKCITDSVMLTKVGSKRYQEVMLSQGELDDTVKFVRYAMDN